MSFRKRHEKLRRILCGGVLPLVMVASMTSYAAEAPETPGNETVTEEGAVTDETGLQPEGAPSEQTLSGNGVPQEPTASPEEETNADEVQVYELKRESEQKEAPEVHGECVEEGGIFRDTYYVIWIQENDGYVTEDGMTISVNGTPWNSTSKSLLGWTSTPAYSLDVDGNAIYFAGGSKKELQSNDVIVIQREGYQDLTLTVSSADGDNFGIQSSIGSETDPGEEVPPVEEEEKTIPTVKGNYDVRKVFISEFDFQQLVFDEGDAYVQNVQELWINGERWTEKESLPYNESGYYRKVGSIIEFNASSGLGLKAEDIITIKSEGYEDLYLKVVSATYNNFQVEKTEKPEEVIPPAEKKEAPAYSARKETGFNNYQIIAILDDTEYLGGVTEILVNDEPWQRKEYSMAVFGKGGYYFDINRHEIQFDGTGDGVLVKGDKITIKNDAYKDLVLSVTKAGRDAFEVAPYDESNPVTQDKLYVRLVGKFESAMKGQKDYDAISGASTSVSVNKNSDVTVQAAELPEGQEPTEDDWFVLDMDSNITVNTDRSKTYVSIEPEGSGMIGVYSPYDGSLTLAGTPEEPGEYAISVTYTDSQDRTAISNELPFVIYEGSEKLYDCLTLDHSTQTADGKYMYDMEPWAITEFGGENETVTVPSEIKAWYGSHTSGTYGELGYAVTGEPTQTLRIPSGCNLTMVNMKVLSSVRIVVEDGGKLVLRDTSLYGKIEVENGGRFSMNYDDYTGTFLNGAMINGQVVLKDGAVLEHASIYSNTNYLTDGLEARHNTAPVVLVQGNVTVEGQVFIRGDEAPSGTDASTQKSYAGQTALKIENGNLHIPEGSVVAAYGGGHLALTSVGGTAVTLQNGTVTGEGKLIAVGGRGSYEDGGNGISGSGTLSVKQVYLEGGSTSFPKDESIVAGKSAEESVTLVKTTDRKLVEGKRIQDNSESVPNTYWTDITKIPDLSLYQVEANAPGEDKDDEQKPGEGDNNNPGGNEGNNPGDNNNPGESEGNNPGDNNTPGESEGDTSGDNNTPGESEGDTSGDNNTPGESEGDTPGDNNAPGESEGNNPGDSNTPGESEGNNPGDDKNPGIIEEEKPGNDNQNSGDSGNKEGESENSSSSDNNNQNSNSKKSHSHRSSSSSDTPTAPVAPVVSESTTAASAAATPTFSRTYSSAQQPSTVNSAEESEAVSIEEPKASDEILPEDDSEETPDNTAQDLEKEDLQIEDEEVPLSNTVEKPSVMPWLFFVVVAIAGGIFLLFFKKRQSEKS